MKALRDQPPNNQIINQCTWLLQTRDLSLHKQIEGDFCAGRINRINRINRNKQRQCQSRANVKRCRRETVSGMDPHTHPHPHIHTHTNTHIQTHTYKHPHPHIHIHTPGTNSAGRGPLALAMAVRMSSSSSPSKGSRLRRLRPNTCYTTTQHSITLSLSVAE